MTVMDLTTARLRAESLMSSTCRLFTVGAPTTDPNTGEVTRSEVGPVVTACRVRPNANLESQSDAGGAEVVASGYVISVPFGLTPSPRIYQRMVITASPDAALVGLSLEVRQVAKGDNITARRLMCEEVA